MSVRLVSWNVNGIRAAVRKGAVDSLRALNADLICLQETRATPDQIPDELAALEGYTWTWNPAVKKGYSGTAIGTRVDATTTPGLGWQRYEDEGRTTVTRHPAFTLVNGYFPNGGKGPERLAFKLDYYADLLAWICRERANGRPVIVTGDLNTSHTELDLARPAPNRKKSGFMDIERVWLDRYLSAGFVDAFRLFESEGGHYTWWSNRGGARERNVGWRLDYFLVTQDLSERVRACTHHIDVTGSDHCPVSLDLEL